MTINNPSHAIIHVAILINTIMRTGVKWGLVEVSSLLASFLLEIGSLRAAVWLVFEWSSHLSVLKRQMENAEQMFQNLIWTTMARKKLVQYLDGTKGWYWQYLLCKCFRPVAYNPGPGGLSAWFSCFPALHEVLNFYRNMLIIQSKQVSQSRETTKTCRIMTLQDTRVLGQC